MDAFDDRDIDVLLVANVEGTCSSLCETLHIEAPGRRTTDAKLADLSFAVSGHRGGFHYLRKLGRAFWSIRNLLISRS